MASYFFLFLLVFLFKFSVNIIFVFRFVTSLVCQGLDWKPRYQNESSLNIVRNVCKWNINLK